ncbi:MAG: S-layer homology domain-containing protein, partial [Terriglobia bacterium]
MKPLPPVKVTLDRLLQAPSNCGAGVVKLISLAALAAVAAFGQCTYTVTPLASFVDSALQGGIAVQVTSSAPACTWTASSTGFAVADTPSGTGNGTVHYSVPANATGADRITALTVAGQTVTLTQRYTANTFGDVLPDSFYFNAANLMRQDSITAGCAAVPTLQYCGELNVTRRQMAVFVIRTIFGGGTAGNNFTYPTTPYFTDVPSTDPNFKYVQKMRDLGITGGCSATTYCPDANVTRDQMAVFIVRARLGATATFTFNPTPYFVDVPADYQPPVFFKSIQKLKEIGITGGCAQNGSLTSYCPASFVTRGQMAIFLVRAGFNALFTANTPLLSSVSPNSGMPGSSVQVTVTGVSTNFVAGTTTIAAANGVTAGAATVTDATHLNVTLTIPVGTPQGPISLTATTGAEQATIPNGFTIGLGDPVPTITSFSPAAGPIGTAVTLTGTGLVSSAGTPADVQVALQGGGVVSAPVTASSGASLSFVIPSTATTGPITVAGSSGSVTSASAFTVTPSSTFSVAMGPGAANLIAGQAATYTVTV